MSDMSDDQRAGFTEMTPEGKDDFNTQIINEFRANAGVVGGPFEGAPMVLIHTIGAKSGAERINPLAYQPVGDDLAIFASAGGSTKNPGWFHNIKATPRITIEVGSEKYEADARVLTGDERTVIWEKQKANMPGFGDYELTANREIPVVLLSRAS